MVEGADHPACTLSGVLVPDIATAGRRQLAMERLGGEIRLVRESAGLSQKMLGDALECTQGKINKLEDGSNRVKLPELEKIIEVCRVGEDFAGKLRTMAYEIESLTSGTREEEKNEKINKLKI